MAVEGAGGDFSVILIVAVAAVVAIVGLVVYRFLAGGKPGG